MVDQRTCAHRWLGGRCLKCGSSTEAEMTRMIGRLYAELGQERAKNAHLQSQVHGLKFALVMALNRPRKRVA